MRPAANPANLCKGRLQRNRSAARTCGVFTMPVNVGRYCKIYQLVWLKVFFSFVIVGARPAGNQMGACTKKLSMIAARTSSDNLANKCNG